MAGLTVDDITKSVACREIFGLGEARDAAKATFRLLNCRCAALLDIKGPSNLTSWLAGSL